MRPWQAPIKVAVSPSQLVPLSYSAFRSLSSCALQFGFSRDKRFPPKVGPAARMGSAFHQTLAYLAGRPDATLDMTLRFFGESLKSQHEQAAKNFREKHLPWSREIREVMENTLAIMVSSTRVSRPKQLRRAIETTLASDDGLLLGRPDEVIVAESGTIIVDFKTGRFREEELSDFEDQIHFYAGLWDEVHRDPPRIGRVEFLLSGKRHKFDIDENRWRSLLASAREAATRIQSQGWEPLANVGEHCSSCAFRPWCEEYWRQGPSGLGSRAGDLEGVVCGEHPPDSRALCVQDGANHRAVTNKAREPLSEIKPGSRVRLVDLATDGTVWFYSDWSELFSVAE